MVEQVQRLYDNSILGSVCSPIPLALPSFRVCLQLLFRELTTAKWDSRLQRGFQLPNPLVIRYVKVCPAAQFSGTAVRFQQMSDPNLSSRGIPT